MKDIVYFIIIAVVIAGSLSGFYFFFVEPQNNRITQMIADDDAKTKAENMTIHSMNCKELGDWLLSDKWFQRDNLIWAQNHYLVNCK